MVDTDALRAAWTLRGKTQQDAAKVLNISDRTMTQRMKNGVFGSDEIEALIKAFDIENPMRIFFAHEVT